MTEAPIRIGHADEGATADACGCCDGTALATVQPVENRPGLPAIAFRVGDHARFKASMLTGLASAAHPALARLRTREDDDFSIALIDAWAACCDVLTFYQERLANESYIGTATERLSVTELARLIGYRLHPGASAETELVLLMEDPPAAAPDVSVLTVPAGTRVQSQPGPDELPQVFETLEDLETRVAWNRLRPRLTEPVAPDTGDRFTWLAGLPVLAVGDAILITGRNREEEDPGSELWDFRRVTAVAPDAAAGRTRVTWDRPLGSVSPPGEAAQIAHRFYHLRERVNFFGYNAPHPKTLSNQQRSHFGFGGTPESNPPSPISTGGSGDWVFGRPAAQAIWLDAIHKGFVEGSWIVLAKQNGLAEAYRITSATDDGVARYAISGRASRLSLDTAENLDLFDGAGTRRTSVYGASLQLPLAEHPITEPVAGSEVELGQRVEGLEGGRRLIFTGPRARLRHEGVGTLTIAAPGGGVQSLARGQEVTLMGAPQPVPATINLRYDVLTDTGFRGQVVAAFGVLRGVAPPKGAEVIAEPATLASALAVGADRTRLVLQEALGAAYDRAGLAIHANVARAAHGEGVSDILGSGDPSVPFQKFVLKHAPVSQRLAATETGVESTLRLRIDGVAWQEVPDLYDRGPEARVYRTSLTDAGETVVEFGDGRSGARPTPGRDNIFADHSRGLGRAGNLRAGQLSLPLDRPLGLKEMVNPLPATGGADPETMAEARRNAPIHTLTLGRVVSVSDYRDFALGFPGIAKAEARWVWQGGARRIVVTVAGEDGATLPATSATYANLLAAYRALGDPLVGVALLSYQPVSFRLGLRLAVDPARETDRVKADLEAALHAAFAFAARDFGGVLSQSEVAAAAHRVPGVAAIDIDIFRRTSGPQTAAPSYPRLTSRGARQGSGGVLLPAEILTLQDGPLAKLELMP
ncbi:putative baseplate assembly protein [Salipiger sp. H15]|uniref:Baseplate assembly protein n=1 Tax=Alloyangia sp. H15 TaxID=3029062 RepID=A0AAU8AL81_9RHOB